MRTIILTDVQQNSLIKTNYIIPRSVIEIMKELIKNKKASGVVLYKKESGKK